MPPSPNASAIILAALFLGIVTASIVLWIRQCNRGGTSSGPGGLVPAWRIGWVNFGLFFCALVLIATFVQQVGFFLMRDTIEANGGQLTPWLAVAAVCLLQLPLLATFQASRQLYPHLYADRINAREMRLPSALRRTFPLFIRYLPLVWMLSLVWSLILIQLQKYAILDEIPPQELVLLFTGGGDPVAITLLALFAVILAPLVEELIFRGCIYRFLKSQIAPVLAQILSAVLFALLHANAMSFLPLVLLGVILARVYEQEGNILVPISFHALFNGFTLLLLLLSDPFTLQDF